MIFFLLWGLLPFQKQNFARLRRIGVPPKEEKCHFLISLIERHFFMHFYLPFQFFKVIFEFFLHFQNQHFARLKGIGVPPKEEKYHFFFCLIKWHFLMLGYLPFQFFKVLFYFCAVPETSIFSRLMRIGVPQKEKKLSLLFFCNRA